MDCQNVTDFFRKCGVLAMQPRELFDYVTHASLKTREAEQAYLDEMRERAEGRRDNRGADGKDDSASVEHRVFMQAYIPQSLFGVRDVEAETAKVIQGDTSGLAYFEKMHGLSSSSGAAASGAQVIGQSEKAEMESDGSSSSDSEDDDVDDDNNDGVNPRRIHVQDKGRAGMTKEEQKLHRAAVKEAKRLKRKEKVPKHVKKSHSKK
jgi:RIO kinase 1